jgi:hypothetical protein
MYVYEDIVTEKDIDFNNHVGVDFYSTKTNRR